MREAKRPSIGVLALQGAFGLHRAHVEASGARYVEVRDPNALASVDALILPGGESSAMLKLLACQNLESALAQALKTKPAWGICAGAILMAESVTSPGQRSFGVIPVAIERNAYGRQLESTQAVIAGYSVSYIRAPRILRVGEGAEVMASRDDDPVWVERGKAVVTTFHPETNRDVPSPWHRRLVRKVTG